MPREREGSIFKRDGRWYVRIRYTDAQRRKREIKRRAESKKDAENLLAELLDQLEDDGYQLVESDRLTFAELAALYQERFLCEPVYVGDVRISGLRSWQSMRSRLLPLVEYFGRQFIKDIRAEDLEQYRLRRMKTPKAAPKPSANGPTAYKPKKPPSENRQRSIATVNRELELLRACLGWAVREGMLRANPFDVGRIILKSQEVQRERILTFDEEDRILAQLVGPRAHLLPLILAALDTGARRGELLKLQWKNVDFGARTILLTAKTTKTEKARMVGMTERLEAALRAAWLAGRRDAEALVFGIQADPSRAWSTACELAGVTGVRFHDLRHTSTSRMVRAGMPDKEVMKITGHTQITTFLRYVNTDADTARRASSALDELRRQEAALKVAQRKAEFRLVK
jgi:integrase